MKLLVLSRYTRKGASSRLRTMQYAGFLESAGIDATYASFFDDAYLEASYGDRPTRPSSVGYFLNRAKQVRKGRNYDCIWLEKEAFPWLPYWIEKALAPSNVPIVSDYDDAVFHRYDCHPNGFVRKALGRKMDRLMSESAIVFAGNNYLAERARTAGAQCIEVVPTVVDVQKYGVRHTQDASQRPRIVWIGTPNTWSSYMRATAPLLSSIVSSGSAQFYAIGAGSEATQINGTTVLPWSEDSEVENIRSMDIGIMPLTDDPFSQGKCGYKLIQYMACGLPVVASPIGANRLIVDHGINGFLASTPDEWRDALNRLIADPDLRRKMGNRGRSKIIDQYSLQSWGPKVAQLLLGAPTRSKPC